MTEGPGTQLNRWVQEHVLGWIAWAEQRSDYVAVTYQKPGEGEPYRKYQKWETMKERYAIMPYSEIDTYKHAVYGDKDFSTDKSEA